MALTFSIAAFTDKGTVRSTQQDAVLIGHTLLTDGHIELNGLTEFRCFVADGIAKSSDGAFAAQFVLGQLASVSYTEYEDFLAAIRLINNQLIVENRQNNNTSGTTLSGVICESGRISVVHVGDSEVYLIRQGKLLQLSTNQCETVTDQYRRAHPGYTLESLYAKARNTLTSYLGGVSNQLTFDRACQTKLDSPIIGGIQAGDYLLICSDGLFKSMTKTALRDQIDQHESIFDALAVIRQLTVKLGCEDNLSMVLVAVEANCVL